MNLLLYTQSRITLSHLRHNPTPGNRQNRDDIEAMTLPDSIFEELGYFGALDESTELETSEIDGDDPYEELFLVWNEPILTR